MASGVAINPQIKDVLEGMRKKKHLRYCILSLDKDMKEVVVVKEAEAGVTYDDFMVDMKEAEDIGECRWAIYDYIYKTDGGAPKQKLVLVSWSPEGAKVKQKMVYASSQDTLKRTLGASIGVFLQATDSDELQEKSMLDKIKSTDRA